jgi:DnaJ-class molecular chaperone
VADETLGTDQVDLERRCEECNGKGGSIDSYSGARYPCSACDGTGFVLTAAGERLFAFFQRMVNRAQFRAQPHWPFG